MAIRPEHVRYIPGETRGAEAWPAIRTNDGAHLPRPGGFENLESVHCLKTGFLHIGPSHTYAEEIQNRL